MADQELPRDFIDRCNAVTDKRPRTVIQHILQHGFITTDDLKYTYLYDHPPRAARDVRELGIPLETFRVKGRSGRSIAAYRFGDTAGVRFSKLAGRTAFAAGLKKKLIELNGCRCAIYQEPFDEPLLQIDHRIPYEVGGDGDEDPIDPAPYMLLSGSANRAKSWSCEHCRNWHEIKDTSVCRSCYWAYPADYEHVAMRPIRRADVMWSGDEITDYEHLKADALLQDTSIPAFIKAIIRNALR